MTHSSAAIDFVAPPAVRASGRPVRWFYVGMSIACLVTTISGFAHSFYLRPSTKPALAPLVVVHGVVFSAWVVLFATQTSLVAAGRTALHRRLGLAGVGLAVLILVLGPVVAFPAARRGAIPLDFLLVILGDLVMYTVFVGAAIYYRRRSETHKRLMLLAMVSLLPPAISRWPIAVSHPAVIGGVVLAFLVAPLAYDRMVRRRLHPATLWGGLALLASIPVRFAIAQTDTWHRVANWLIR